MSRAVVLSAVCWAGCQAAGGSGEDDPPLSESWGPTSEWPTYDPSRPRPGAGGGSETPTKPGEPAPAPGADGDAPQDEEQQEGQKPPSEGPRIPPWGGFDASIGIPTGPRLDGAIGPAAPSRGDAGVPPCNDAGDAGVESSAEAAVERACE